MRLCKLLSMCLLVAAGCSRNDDPGSSWATDAPPDCGSSTPEQLAACVDQAGYEQAVRQIAFEREPGSDHWRAVQQMCVDAFASAGYQIERHEYGSGVNIVGTKLGRSPERVILSAHYDHIGGCAGADDNASGVAGLLQAAQALSRGTYQRTLVVACWDEEERGMLGSQAYATRAREAQQPIRASLVFEAIGYVSSQPGSQQVPKGFGVLFPSQVRQMEQRESRADFIALVANSAASNDAALLEQYAGKLELPTALLKVPSALIRTGLADDLMRSDHASFWSQGYPSIMLTDTANFRNPNYHCLAGADDVQSLDMSFATKVTKTAVAAAAQLAGL